MSNHRQFVQFQVAEDEFQMIHQNTDTIGWLKDISHQGLSYEYIATDKQKASFEDIGLFSNFKTHRLSRWYSSAML